MKLTYALVILLLTATAYASQKAITDTGEEVILNDDGSWQLSGNAKNIPDKIKTNKKSFRKPKAASFLLKSTKNNSAYWINTNKWSFKKAANNPEAEYEFVLKGEDLYGMAIAEGVEISVESLTDIAVTNAKNVAPDIKIVKKEYRNVNGKKVVYMEMKGTAQSIKFTYLGYYYSNASGSTQLVLYTGTNLVNKYRSEINNLLNGLTEQ